MLLKILTHINTSWQTFRNASYLSHFLSSALSIFSVLPSSSPSAGGVFLYQVTSAPGKARILARIFASSPGPAFASSIGWTSGANWTSKSAYKKLKICSNNSCLKLGKESPSKNISRSIDLPFSQWNQGKYFHCLYFCFESELIIAIT